MHYLTLTILNNCCGFVQTKLYIFGYLQQNFWLVIIFLINLTTDSKPNNVEFYIHFDQYVDQPIGL